MTRAVIFVMVLLGGCASGPVSVHDYHGRCGDPPHGTAVRLLSCELRMNDAASGGDWRVVCD